MTLRAREQDIRREQGGQQHLHEPGPARACRVACGWRRSGRTGCGTWPRSVPRAPRSWRRRSPPSARPASTRAPTSTSSPSGCPTRPPSTHAARPRGPRRACRWPRPLPGRAELADALLVCATEVTTSDEIARFARALSDELAGRRPMRPRPWELPDGRRRTAPPADALRASQARTRQRQGAAPAQGRARPHAGRAAADVAARPARARRARGRPPLRQPVAAQLRGRHGLLPARLVHHEVQPQGQRVGRAAARLRPPPPDGPRRRRPGHARSSCGSWSRCWPRSAACAPSPSSPRPARTAS